MSLTAAHFDTPEFQRLSANGQAYLRAMGEFTNVYVKAGGDLSALGEPGPEFYTPEMNGAKALVDKARDAMTEAEGEEMSNYAHRMDYPEMYEKESP